MANPVTYLNIFSEVRNNYYALINNKSNVTDPTSISGRKWIYSREPDVKAINFSGYPYIILYSSNIDLGTAQSGNSQIQDHSFSIEIEVVTCDRDFGNKDGVGLAQMDAISNDIFTTLNSEESRKILRANGLKFIKPSATNVSVESQNNTLVYRRSFLISNNMKKKVF